MTDAAPITLVTAYFQVASGNRNRAPRDYFAWMANFLPVVQWPLVIFCDEQSADEIKRLRGDKPAVYHIIRWEDFSVHRHREILRAHIAQRWPGVPADLSLLYHEKANFVRRAIDENPFASEMFFWCDIGMFRSMFGHPKGRALFHLSERVEWPNFAACRAAFGKRVAFFAAADAAHRRARPWVLATVWGGRNEPLRRFCGAYYRFLAGRMLDNPARPGAVVPKGFGYHSEEVLINAMSESADFNIRVFTTKDVRWLGALEWAATRAMPAPAAGNREVRGRENASNVAPPPRGMSHGAHFFVSVFYCLNAGRFPWAHLGREISLSAGPRLAAKIIRRRVASKRRRRPISES